MACGDRVQVSVTYWGWCWALFVPYPCRKTETKWRYEYVFNPHRTRFAWFSKSYEGCCGGLLYKWSEGRALFGTGNGAWNHNAVTKHLASPATSIGDCPFNEPGFG